MKEHCKLSILLFLFTCICSNTYAGIVFSKQVNCSFDYYQYLDANSHKSKKHKPLKWSFAKLNTKSPIYISAGDTGGIFVHQHQTSNGISIFLPQGNGAHLFSIWPSGIGYWSKQNNLFGSTASQQFRGTCSN